MEHKEWKECSPLEIENAVRAIGENWMLIVAKDEKQNRVNAMTASWGCIGMLWNKPVAICFIRPQRYTYGLVESAERISLAFPDASYRSAMTLCGRKSGRDCDKLTEAGLTSSELDGVPVIDQAEWTLVCRKLYADDLKEKSFLDASLLSNYKDHDFHRVYVCEIEKVYRKNSDIK